MKQCSESAGSVTFWVPRSRIVVICTDPDPNPSLLLKLSKNHFFLNYLAYSFPTVGTPYVYISRLSLNPTVYTQDIEKKGKLFLAVLKATEEKSMIRICNSVGSPTPYQIVKDSYLRKTYRLRTVAADPGFI